jgi:hypothetical protein
VLCQDVHRCDMGVVGLSGGDCTITRKVINRIYSGTLLERAAGEGESPVDEIDAAL